MGQLFLSIDRRSRTSLDRNPPAYIRNARHHLLPLRPDGCGNALAGRVTAGSLLQAIVLDDATVRLLCGLAAVVAVDPLTHGERPGWGNGMRTRREKCLSDQRRQNRPHLAPSCWDCSDVGNCFPHHFRSELRTGPRWAAWIRTFLSQLSFLPITRIFPGSTTMALIPVDSVLARQLDVEA